MAAVGLNIISPRGDMPFAEMLSLYARGKFPLVKLHVDEAFSTDPSDVRALLQLGTIETVILRTADGLRGYDYKVIQATIEQPGGIAGYSYADLMHEFPQINWWIEIGNEPNLHGVAPWIARWWALAAYKELALNYLGHIDRPWREKYPMLKWMFSLPTDYEESLILMQWLDHDGQDDVGDGGALDYYDAVGAHLYGDYEVISRNYDWPKIYDYLLASPYVKEIFITEMGINDDKTPTRLKVRKYRDFANSAPDKVKGCAVWFLGRHKDFRNYELTEAVDMDILGGRRQA
jgi:hypothetical protein